MQEHSIQDKLLLTEVERPGKKKLEWQAIIRMKLNYDSSTSVVQISFHTF